MSKVDEIMSQAHDTITVGKVYGTPYERDGVTLIPAASVRGGGGGGEAEPGEDQQGGSGGGFGVWARPVGAYKIRGDEVEWVPAADTTAVIILSEVILIVALLVLRSILRVRRTVG